MIESPSTTTVGFFEPKLELPPAKPALELQQAKRTITRGSNSLVKRMPRTRAQAVQSRTSVAQGIAHFPRRRIAGLEDRF